jgi:hypothetical protein
MNDGFNRFSGFCSLPPATRSFARIIPCFLGKNRDKAFAKNRTWSKAMIKTGLRDSINMGPLKVDPCLREGVPLCAYAST